MRTTVFVSAQTRAFRTSLVLPLYLEEFMAIPSIVRQHAPILHFHPREGRQCCFPGDAEVAYKLIRAGRFREIRQPKSLDANVPCYFQYSYNLRQPGVGPTVSRIKYWFWYTFNDFPEGPDPYGHHEGDWESLEVILLDGKPHCYLLSNHHTRLPIWPVQGHFRNGRIQLWVANGSHALYPDPNSTVFKYSILWHRFQDQIIGGGPVWDTRSHLVDMASTTFGKERYTGVWGNHVYIAFNYVGTPPRSPVGRQFESAIPYYQVTVKTGSRRDAGTDANVFLTLKGTGGRSPEFELDNYSDNFEAGIRDEFAPGSDAAYGKIQKIIIRHDNSGGKSGWFLDHIAITDRISNRQLLFNCGRWLARDEDDGAISRTLSAPKVINPGS
jgi:hypothetical protein